jgi:uncharacterized protein YndB with AHSA1/START domain
MPHEFELRKEITLDATPEQVWEAIATGPGIDGWFMGRNQVEPREGGRTSMTIGGHTEEGVVTVWEPGRRFAYRAGNPDAEWMAFEWLIEGRDDGARVPRLVQSGVLGDNWETEYDALGTGWDTYLHQLAQYLAHFRGRPVAPVLASSTVRSPSGTISSPTWTPRRPSGPGRPGSAGCSTPADDMARRPAA